nr:doubled motif LPXTG anchor domain-containing protein [uncultured Lachnoclostridium sp.]
MRHYAPVVADNENGDAAPEPKEETDAPEAKEDTETQEPEKEEEPNATEAPEKEEAAVGKDETTEAIEGTTETTEAAGSAESPQASEESAEGTDAEADKETTVPDTEETTAASEESGFTDNSESKADVSSEPEGTVGTATSSTAQQTEESPSEEKHVSKAGTTDLVGMGYCSTAKVYAATLNQLKALDDFDGYKVSYAVYPEASARIVEGLRGVEEGGTLTFGVKNQLGSAIDYVSVNDEIIEADAVVDNENGSQTAWYSVPDIYEEQDVEVYMNETMAHPAVELEPIVMDDGVIIYISADEGVLPVGVTASAARVSEDVENAVKETAQADAEGKIVSSVMAYDINLWLGDKLLDSDIWGGSKRVRVTFAGAPVEEQNAQSDKVEVMYVETVQDNDKEEKEKVAAQEIDVQAADIVNVEAVGASVDEASVSFEAKHFSIYAIVGTEQYKNSYTMYAGQTIRLEARNALIGGTWTSSDPSVVSVEESGTVWYPYAFVHAKDTSGKTVTLTYSYGWNGRYKQKFEITVKKHEVKAYFYVQRPGMDPDSLENKDWKYVGYGNIDVSGIKNQHGTDMVGGEGHYSLDNPAGRVINYPSDTNIKKIIADLYGVNVNDIDVEISYSPYKITYPMGWVDADNNPHDQGKAVYHVDMTASVTTREKATATYWLWDAGEQGYQPVESHDVSIGDKTSPKKVYDDVKTVDGVEYRFSGWYADAERSQAVGFPYQVDKMVNFYAKYIPNPFITIYYEAVGGGSVSPSTDQFMAYTEGPAGSTGTTPLGYEFKGWFNNDMGLGTPISTNLKFTPSKPAGGWTDGMTFYAVWEGNSDALTYDANKGTGEMSASTGNVGSEVAVKENQFTRQGYYFAGWNTKADGTGTTYMPGENYTLTAGDDILFAVWKEVGTFKVWAYYPDTNPDLSYGDYINIYEDYGPDNAPLTYKKNGTQSGENLTLEGINEILAYSKAETEANHMGAKISSVYLQYETNAGWSKAIYATLKDSKAIAFDGLDDEVFHEGKESRLHITYKLPRTVQVEYWKNIGTGYELVPSEGYGIGPDFVYAYDYISISETSSSSQDIIKAVPASLRGYSTGKVVFKTGTDVPSGEEDDLGKSFRVKDTRAAQRICILLEENEDVTLTYVAGLGGSVNPASETVAPATGIAKGSAAKASPGYHFVNWTVADKVVGTNVSLERQEIDAVAKASGVYKATEFKANFEEDADITINYVAAKGGNVDLSSETLAPATGKPEGSKAVAKDGYVFTHWTDTAGTKVGVDADFIPKKNPETQVFEADTYTAHFAIRGDLSYKVEYYYDGVLGEVDSKDNVVFGTDIPFTTVPRDFNGRNYIFESANGPKTVGSDSNVNLVKVYYVLDEIGVEIPQNPDGIPDKYQITFTFVTGNNGTVSGTTSEVHTIQQITRDPETNEIIKVGSVTPAHPRANVTAAANSGYAFSNWSIDGNAGKTYNNTDAIQADAFVHDTTFIANFRTAGGSGGNGGGGGGSNSGGPGRFSQSDDSGPGAVNIAPQDVPLAPLPETPFDTTLINDDEIPLAPLPKTGQGSVKSTLTMVMSGILLMLTAMSKKRKDEDA